MKNINTLMINSSFWKDFQAVQRTQWGPYAPHTYVLYAAYMVLWAFSMGVSWQATLLMSVLLAILFSLIYKMKFSELLHETFERSERGEPTMLGPKMLSITVPYLVAAYVTFWSIVAFR